MRSYVCCLIIPVILVISLSCKKNQCEKVTGLRIYSLSWKLFTVVRITPKTIKTYPGVYSRTINDHEIFRSIVSMLDSLKPVEGYTSSMRLLCEISYNEKNTDTLGIGDNQLIWLNGKPYQPSPELVKLFLPLIPKEHAPIEIFNLTVPYKQKPWTLEDEKKVDSLLNLMNKEN